MDDEQGALTDAQVQHVAERVHEAALPLRKLVRDLVAVGAVNAGDIAAAALMLAGEIAEQMQVDTEAAEKSAIGWFRGGRANMAMYEARQLAAQNGGKLNG